MSAGRRYRVVQEFLWIEGGNLAPDASRWEGGEIVVYQPGDFVCFQEDEVRSRYYCLEALDDAGRAALEEVRAKVTGPAKVIYVGDLDPDTVEFLTDALREKRAPPGCEDLRTYQILRDGTKVLCSTKSYPLNPEPGMVYDDNGQPDLNATALQKDRQERDSQIAQIRRGGSLGRLRGLESKRDAKARKDAALLADVRAHRALHPSHGLPAIAAALVDQHGKILDHADPRGREKAIAALRKRIARLEKSLDT